MSDPSGTSTVNHNDDQDESTSRNSSMNIGHGKITNLNSRITSPLIIKRQQVLETEIANNQAYDEIHEVQSKHSQMKKTINDERKSTHHETSRDLMQSNYYDRTRFDSNFKVSSERGLLNINVEDYKKKIATVPSNKQNSSKNRAHSPPFGETSESIQEGVAQSAGALLETNKSSAEQVTTNERSMKKNQKTHERAAIDYFPNKKQNQDDDRTITKQRSESSSSDSSGSNSSTSTNDQQSSSKFDSETTIPYQKLSEEDDEEEENSQIVQQEVKPNPTESTNLLNKNQSTTYGTQTMNKITTERSKYLQTNGYNSHGSSVTTKSSSDNSGSIRTNSDSDNDEESDEEHYNNSTVENNSTMTSTYTRVVDSSTKTLNSKINDHRYNENSFCSNENPNYRSSGTHTEQEANTHDGQHLQLPRNKQCLTDYLSEANNRKDNVPFEYSTGSSFAKKSPSQTSGNNSSSSSHQHRNLPERSDQSSNLNSNRRTTMRSSKKRKQSQQQDIIRTESIPGHRGDRDVDELVMFIDGNSSKISSNNTETKTNSLTEVNSNKSGAKKKSRKTSKTAQLTATSSTEQNETSPLTNETLTEIKIDETQHVEQQQTEPSENEKTETSSTRLQWFEQVDQENFQEEKEDKYQSVSVTNKIATPLNSTVATDSFVTVTRRRPIKERRQDSNSSFTGSSRFSTTSNTMNYEKRRYTPMSQQENVRSSPRNSLAQLKTNIVSPSKDDNSNSTNQQEILNDKPQSSPRLSSQSSNSSLPSLNKRQSKPPPVVFLNKSINVELDDVSFGFDFDSVTVSKSTDEKPPDDVSTIIENKNFQADTTSTTSVFAPSITHDQIPNDNSIDSTMENIHENSAPIRTTRDPQFYSGPDIRPHHRPYPTANVPTGPSYIDPRLLISYSQPRYPGYSTHLGYMNYMRAPYIPSQPQYVIVPSTSYPTKVETDVEEKTDEEFTGTPATETIQEPLLVYTTVPNPAGQIYYHPATGKSAVADLKQNPTTLPAIYPAPQTVYPASIFYPRIPQQAVAGNIFPSPAAYFQPIASPSLYIETKTDQQENDQNIYDYNNPSKSYSSNEQLPSTSSDIMSSALQLVYSRQRQNAQTDRFNLDDLTAYLTMKWKETVDHYDQGDSRILVVERHE